jgi:hypothetical protein
MNESDASLSKENPDKEYEQLEMSENLDKEVALLPTL